MRKSLIALLLIILMVLPLAACGQEVVYTYTNLPGKERTYNAIELELDMDLKEGEEYHIGRIQATEKRIHTVGILSRETEEGRYMEHKYFAFDYKGRVKEESVLQGMSFQCQFFEDGQFFYIDRNVTDTDNADDTQSVYPYELVYCDASGKEVKRIHLLDESPENIIEGYVWQDSIGRLIPGKDKHVYVLYRNRDYLDDVDLINGTITSIDTNEVTAEVWHAFRFYMDGLPVIEQKNKLNKRYYHAIDVSTGTADEAFTLLGLRVAEPEDLTDCPVGLQFYDGAGGSYNLVVRYKYGIYGFHIGDDELTQIVDLSGCELADYSIEDIAFLSDERFVVQCRYWDMEENHQKRQLVVFDAQKSE